MNVAFVTTNYPPDSPGGAGRSSQLIVEGLRENGLDVDVFALVGDEKELVETEPGTYRLPSSDVYPGPSTIGENWSSVRYLPKLDEYDVVHVYNVRHLPACILKRSPPVLATYNNHMWVCIDPVAHLRDGMPACGVRQNFRYARSRGFGPLKSVVRTAIETAGKSLAKRADAVTVQTEGMKHELVQCGYASDDITVVPNLVDPRFDIEPRNTKTVMFAGRLVEQKGPQLLARAFASLPDDLQEEWSLEIYGSGPLEERIGRLIEDIPNAEINYCPYEDLPEVYAEAGVFVHPSRYNEPFSRCWLEAMASGTPLLCSRHPSSEAVLQNLAEFSDPYTITDLQSSLEKMMKEPNTRRRYVKVYDQEVNQYQPTIVAEIYRKAYQKVLDTDSSVRTFRSNDN